MTDLFWTVYRVVVAGFFGLLIGSFLNVCIYRLPRGETIVRGHSYCPHCHHKLSGADLVPVFSYLLLKRRCRYCRRPIAARYAKIETITGFGYAMLVWLWGDPSLSPVGKSGSLLPGVPETVASAVLIGSLLIAFSAFLVWAMILFDRQVPPRGLYLFLLLPLLVRLACQPQRWLMHLLAAGLAALCCRLILLRQELPRKLLLQHRHLSAGLVLLGFAVAFPAFLPVLLICLILYAWHKKKQPDWAGSFFSMTPPAAVLIAYLAMLII